MVWVTGKLLIKSFGMPREFIGGDPMYFVCNAVVVIGVYTTGLGQCDLLPMIYIPVCRRVCLSGMTPEWNTDFVYKCLGTGTG